MAYQREISHSKATTTDDPKSRLKLTKDVNESRRREQLRAVLALMDSCDKDRNRWGKQPRNYLDEKTETLTTHKQEEALKFDNMLTVANRNPKRLRRPSTKTLSISGATQSLNRIQLPGQLPVNNIFSEHFPEETQRKMRYEDIAEKTQGNTSETNTNQHKMKVRTCGKFRVVAKLIVLLVRFCRSYILTENDAKMIRLFSAIDAAQAGDRYQIKSDLIFDVTQFRANKQYCISNDTKRILGKPPEKRTDKEISHVQTELQPLKFVKRYPMCMQRSMIMVAWYEEFTQGRVITRFGKRPQAFYLILGGSALVLEGDPKNSGRDATTADRGDVFGSDAIASCCTHTFSVISKEPICLLCLSVEDYSRIFLAGGLRNLSDDGDDALFIRSVFLFDGWPIHLLRDNPTMVKFNYYTQGTVIVEDSDNSDWIYIVKSGSCSVMKRLHQEKTTTTTPAKKRRQIHAKRTKAVSHEQKLSLKLQDLQRKRAKMIKGTWRHDVWKPNLLGIPLVEDPLEECADDFEITSETKQINVVSNSSSYDVNEMNMKIKTDAVTVPDDINVKCDVNNTLDRKGRFPWLLPHQRMKLAKIPPKPKDWEQPLYVQIDTLEREDVFGILDIAFGKQLPSMSLVSNGVECVQILKKFYLKHSNKSIAKAITKKMRPYATEDTLTKDLQEKLSWKDHRESTMKDTARKFKRYKKMLANPRLPRIQLLPDL